MNMNDNEMIDLYSRMICDGILQFKCVMVY